MTATIVLDASAAVRAVMDPAGQPALIDRIEGAALVLAPALMRVEAANALWKYARSRVLSSQEALLRHHEGLLLVHRYVEDQALYPEALQWALDADHPVYAALYAVTTRRHAATLVTCDRRLQAACAAAGIAGECYSA